LSYTPVLQPRVKSTRAAATLARCSTVGPMTPEHGTLQAAQIAVLLFCHNNLKDNGK
jgi:hypothetical protein